MAPAGSVYWVEFDDNQAAKAWASAHHFKTISDNEQDQRDGFGLIAIGRGE